MRDLDLDADTQTHYHLHLERPHGEHVVLVSSEKLTETSPGSAFGQDELLICDPPTRTIRASSGCSASARTRSSSCRSTRSTTCSGAARGDWAARRAAAGA